MTRVLIVDDHPVVAKYTKHEVIALRPGAEVLVAGTLKAAEALVGEGESPDYILLDLVLPDCYGLAGLASLRRLAPKAIIAIVSADTSPDVIRDCFAQGARGYVTKCTEADDFTEALRKVFENEAYYPQQAASPARATTSAKLTKRELEVLRALAIGKANKQLAPMLEISESTFKTYLRSIYDKLNARTRVEAVRRGIELGLLDARHL